MPIASISTWLNSPNPSYHHGVSLYKQYGDDSLILAIITTGSGSYHFSKLKQGLQSVNDQPSITPKKLEYVAPAQERSASEDPEEPVYVGRKKVNLDNAPKEIRDIRNNKNLKFAEARHLHAKLRFMDSQQHRCDAALTILNNMDEVNSSWCAMDEWEKTGKITQVEREEVQAAVAELSIPELYQERTNLPSRISHARKRHSTNTDPRKKTKALAKVESLISRFNEVKRRISEL